MMKRYGLAHLERSIGIVLRIVFILSAITSLLLIGMIVFSSDDQGFAETFMTYCQEYETEITDNVAQITDWFPSTVEDCVKALECLDGNMSTSEMKYENQFALIIGEFSDPMAYRIAQCVDIRAWERFLLYWPDLRS